MVVVDSVKANTSKCCNPSKCQMSRRVSPGVSFVMLTPISSVLLFPYHYILRVYGALLSGGQNFHRRKLLSSFNSEKARI